MYYVGRRYTTPSKTHFRFLAAAVVSIIYYKRRICIEQVQNGKHPRHTSTPRIPYM